ncbi:MAG: PhoX family phosphatase [Aquimonas sp.]|nr:PhoX family phosphatase [Aquimonas sp.]
MNHDASPLPYGDEDFDVEDSNRSRNMHFADVLAANRSRRAVLKGGLAAAVSGLLVSPLAAARTERFFADAGKNIPLPLPRRPGFQAVAVNRLDAVTVPPGYTARTAFAWGEGIFPDSPAYLPDGSNTGADQEKLIGQNHDGMHYFPLGISVAERNRRAILAMNHEYIEQTELHPNGQQLVDGKRLPDDVRKEIAAHGVSVFEITRQPNGRWEIVRNSKYNRRVTANTTCEVSGPVRGSAHLITKFSPDGTRTRGTINNCAHGYTPWGTYLTCEENWAGYFVNRGQRPREQTRYGVPTANSRYRWDTVEERFDATAKADSAAGDFRNEPNGQGWILEVDPYNPGVMPVKRTAMGRFAHEGCVFAPVQVGRPMVFYSGDDAQNEYIYKFVTKAVFLPAPLRNDRNALDHGTLYVARFDADGSGEWLPLDFNDAGFRAKAAAAGVSFADQADVLVNTRLAADVAGATRMDRPEWGAVDPRDGQVYFTLTNNSRRSSETADAANPRGPNPFGHIVRWREAKGDHASTRFDWDLFLLSGTEQDSANPAAGPNAKLGPDGIHASPDGLWFDDAGLLWIQTDMSGSQLSSGPFGNNQMLAVNTETGDIRRFLVGPPGCEVTGVVATPDLRTLFVNIQHPADGSHWPDGNGARPRSATVIVTKDDGGIIGS